MESTGLLTLCFSSCPCRLLMETPSHPELCFCLSPTWRWRGRGCDLTHLTEHTARPPRPMAE